MSNSGSDPVIKKRKSQSGCPDPDADVIALSPRTILDSNQYICKTCNKSFRRDQNLQPHKRRHKQMWNLKKTTTRDEVERRKVYVCPETSCVRHDPARALGDQTGIKKHYLRKHCEKKWKCDKCSRMYAVMSDWTAHCKVCRMREYICSCGSLFSKRQNYMTHRSTCEAPVGAERRAPAGLTMLPEPSSISTSHPQINQKVQQQQPPPPILFTLVPAAHVVGAQFVPVSVSPVGELMKPHHAPGGEGKGKAVVGEIASTSVGEPDRDFVDMKGRK